MARAFARFALVAALTTAAPAAQAGIVFSDNFDAESQGLNKNPLANFTVSDGTVDVIGAGFYDFLPGNGNYVDLDGSTADAGVLRSNALTLPAGDYALVFDLAGSQVGEPTVISSAFGSRVVPQAGDVETVTVSVGTSADPAAFGSLVLTRTAADPFTTVRLPFTVGAGTADARLTFANAGGDSIGALLDRVAVETAVVPVPPTAVMAALAVGGAALGRFRGVARGV